MTSPSCCQLNFVLRCPEYRFSFGVSYRIVGQIQRADGFNNRYMEQRVRSPTALDYVRYILNHATIEVPNKENSHVVASLVVVKDWSRSEMK